MTSLDSAGIAPAVKELRGFHLDAQEASLMLDNEVVLGESPQGRVTFRSFSAAAAIKRSSTHSPRRFGCLIFIAFSFIGSPASEGFGRVVQQQ